MLSDPYGLTGGVTASVAFSADLNLGVNRSLWRINKTCEMVANGEEKPYHFYPSARMIRHRKNFVYFSGIEDLLIGSSVISSVPDHDGL